MYRVGIDLGGTNIKAGIVNRKNEILVQKSVPTRVERNYTEIIQDMAEMIAGMCQKIGISQNEIVGIGIGSPGTIDTQKGVVLYSNNFNWENVPVVQEFSRYHQCKIAISNDANCAALGEVKAGAAREYDNAILLTLGTGVGGGIILNGKVFDGAHAGGAELGHANLILGGEPCTCGRKGCIEAYVSATALIRDAKRAAMQYPESILNQLCGGKLDAMDGKMPFDAAAQGDEAAQQVIHNYIMYLGETITDYVNIFRPDIILLSGGVCNQKEKLTDPINEYIKDKCFGGAATYIPEVVCATLGNNAGIIGASCLIEEK